MRCHVCNVEVGEGQRFCHACGESLTGVTDATQELSALTEADLATDLPGAGLAATQATDEVASLTELPNTEAIPATDLPGAGLAATQATDEMAPLTELPNTEAIPATDLPGAGLAATQAIDEMAPLTELPNTEAIPATDLPGAEADDSTADGSADNEVPVGKIGASLFDPATAPPDAEPSWNEPIPPLTDDMFATSAHVAEPPVPETLAANESTTAVPVHEAAAPIEDLTGQPTPLFDADAESGSPLLEGELRPFKFRPTFVLAFLGMIAALMMSVADVTDIRTDRVVAGIPNRVSTVADLGTNLPVAGFIGAAIMLIGGVLHCFGLRWGAGLAGGAGLALAGWAGLTLGLAEVPIKEAEQITRDPNTPGPFRLTVTHDLGYWLIVALAALGLVVFAFSLVSAGTAGRRGLNPWTAALGALAALVIAAGPLITVGGEKFTVNFGTDDLPSAYFAGRIGQLALVAVAGVVGFLLVRSYGLGLAAGGVSVALWMWLSSLLEIGDRPLGIAVLNLRSSDTSPHAVTTVGVALTVAMLIVAATIAIVQSSRSTR